MFQQDQTVQMVPEIHFLHVRLLVQVVPKARLVLQVQVVQMAQADLALLVHRMYLVNRQGQLVLENQFLHVFQEVHLDLKVQVVQLLLLDQMARLVLVVLFVQMVHFLLLVQMVQMGLGVLLNIIPTLVYVSLPLTMFLHDKYFSIH